VILLDCSTGMSVISLIFVLTRLDLNNFYCTVCCNDDLIHMIIGTAPKRGLLVVYSDGMMEHMDRNLVLPGLGYSNMVTLRCLP
jgi:hypothetical protein